MMQALSAVLHGFPLFLNQKVLLDRSNYNLSFAGIFLFCYSLKMDKEIMTLNDDAQQLGIIFSEYQLGQFDTYRKEVLKWNEKTNLISDKSSLDIIRRHFLDSLTALPFIGEGDIRIIDIGCGAGFPGIPLKIASPALRLYLLETNRKKVSFLKHIIRLLNLSDTVVLHERVENLLALDQWKEFFDVLISRAAFKLPEMVPWGAFFLRPGGKLVALKGRDIAEEFFQASAIAQQTGFNQLFQNNINQEPSDITRKIIVGEKAKSMTLAANKRSEV
ncbi:MAG: 16S rRNA (guanine(527)-N(7))-methyltransferase RsmG [Deltaproteobacteria bacterium HGW-Deltaproteobacteria-10]|nr:MAG: 16S rRNA (guanine(527)-N(7))-methyltransferase RsmG [Deltaproteobacteria bacterium HGW-Deltaproteobacteria-10]